MTDRSSPTDCIHSSFAPLTSDETLPLPFWLLLVCSTNGLVDVDGQRPIRHPPLKHERGSEFRWGLVWLSDVGPATAQNLVVKFDGEICGGVLVENASDDFPQQKKLENLLPNFARSSPPISPKTSPTSLWKSLVLTDGVQNYRNSNKTTCPNSQTPAHFTWRGISWNER